MSSARVSQFVWSRWHDSKSIVHATDPCISCALLQHVALHLVVGRITNVSSGVPRISAWRGSRRRRCRGVWGVGRRYRPPQWRRGLGRGLCPCPRIILAFLVESKLLYFDAFRVIKIPTKFFATSMGRGSNPLITLPNPLPSVRHWLFRYSCIIRGAFTITGPVSWNAFATGLLSFVWLFYTLA